MTLVSYLRARTRRARLTAAPAVLGCALILAACGDTPTVQEANGKPLTASHVTINLTGDASVTIPDPNSDVTFSLDNARLLVIHVTLRSTAQHAQTVAVRASLFDNRGTVIGDASGGTLSMQPNADASFELSGPTPIGTIDHATFEVHTATVPSSTPG